MKKYLFIAAMLACFLGSVSQAQAKDCLGPDNTRVDCAMFPCVAGGALWTGTCKQLQAATDYNSCMLGALPGSEKSCALMWPDTAPQQPPADAAALPTCQKSSFEVAGPALACKCPKDGSKVINGGRPGPNCFSDLPPCSDNPAGETLEPSDENPKGGQCVCPANTLRKGVIIDNIKKGDKPLSQKCQTTPQADAASCEDKLLTGEVTFCPSSGDPVASSPGASSSDTSSPSSSTSSPTTSAPAASSPAASSPASSGSSSDMMSQMMPMMMMSMMMQQMMSQMQNKGNSNNSNDGNCSGSSASGLSSFTSLLGLGSSSGSGSCNNNGNGNGSGNGNGNGSGSGTGSGTANNGNNNGNSSGNDDDEEEDDSLAGVVEEQISQLIAAIGSLLQNAPLASDPVTTNGTGTQQASTLQQELEDLREQQAAALAASKQEDSSPTPAAETYKDPTTDSHVDSDGKKRPDRRLSCGFIAGGGAPTVAGCRAGPSAEAP